VAEEVADEDGVGGVGNEAAGGVPEAVQPDRAQAGGLAAALVAAS
jgi:hypothetical protein